MIVNFLIALLILNVMIIAHELGHYFVAKRNGVEVDEFAVGFGPILWSKDWNNTKWLIKLFPLGGYNGLRGEVGDDTGPGTFVGVSKKARLAVLFAGSFMNLVMAIFFFYIAIILWSWQVAIPMAIKPVGGEIRPVEYPYPMVVAVVENGPADSLEIKPPYYISKIDSVEMTSGDDVVSAIANSSSNSISMLLIKDSKKFEVSVEKNENSKIGISINPPPVEIYYGKSVWTKLFSGVSHTVNTTILSGEMIGNIVSYSIKNKDAEPLGYVFAGPAAVVAAVDVVVDNSAHIAADLASMTGLIGVSLAIFNMLPFPGLDGWHIMLIVLEKARGRKANQKIVGIISALGILFMLILGVLIIIKDIFLFF